MTEEYSTYLQSDAWKRKKAQRMRIDGYRCRACGSTKNLQVHHLNYYNVGSENVWTDIATICNDCHVKLHNFMSRPTALLEDGTYRFGWQDTLPESIKCNLQERGLMQ